MASEITFIYGGSVMNSTIPANLLELKARFETWRTNRKYMREPIPCELWNAAADLSRRYPPSLVGRFYAARRSEARASKAFLPFSRSVSASARLIVKLSMKRQSASITARFGYYCD